MTRYVSIENWFERRRDNGPNRAEEDGKVQTGTKRASQRTMTQGGTQPRLALAYHAFDLRSKNG